MMDYIPMNEADVNHPSEYVYFVNNDLREPYFVNNDLREPQAQPPITEEEIETNAQKLTALFSDGFQWSDLASMMRLCRDYLADFRMSSLAQKREAIAKILNRVIDLTDTPFLPDQYTDPLLKAMTAPFLTLIIPDSIGELFPATTVEGMPSDAAIQGFLDRMLGTFKDGFQWTDLVTLSRLSICFVNQYPDLAGKERAETAKSIIDHIIDNTDTPILPDRISDPILKAMAHPFIDLILSVF